MAALQQRNGSYRILFRHHGRQHTFTVGRVSKEEADAKLGLVEARLLRLRQGLLTIPPGADIVAFVQHEDGLALPMVTPRRSGLRLSELRDRYLATHEGAKESNTLGLVRIHFKHLATTLGPDFPLAGLTLAALQGHVDRRIKLVSPVTVEKEIRTLGTAWKWAVRMDLLAGPYPNQGLAYPKTDEKPPFQTRAEIERQVPGLDEEQRKELWNALYLTLPEIDGFLDFVEARAGYAWIHPICCTAAHTGMRRSELLRAKVTDVDFAGGVVLVREKKRVKGKRSMRRVPLSSSLAAVLEEWLRDHPGGPHLFCHAEQVERSKKRSRSTGHQSGEGRATSLKGRLATVTDRDRPGILPLTPKEAHDHLKRTLSDSEWEVVRGYHTLRHSFISACASRGVDQRLIQEWWAT